MAKVSVIIPTYNRAYCIERALKSVQSQTFQDYEVLVCDDASTDETRDIVSAYSAADPRIKFLSLSENQGAAAARNLGMETAQGDYIAFLDSDDEWLPGKLKRQVEVMDAQPPDVGVCFCGGIIIKNGKVDKPVQYLPKKIWEKDTLRKFAMCQIPFLTSTILFRRECLKKSGLMVPEMRRNQDSEFLLRLFFFYRLVVVPEVYAVWHLEVNRARHYDAMRAALPYHLQHYDTIRSKVGRWPALCNHCKRLTVVLCVAIRERKWGESLRWLWRRIRLLPFFLPSEWHDLLRAAYASLANTSRKGQDK